MAQEMDDGYGMYYVNLATLQWSDRNNAGGHAAQVDPLVDMFKWL